MRQGCNGYSVIVQCGQFLSLVLFFVLVGFPSFFSLSEEKGKLSGLEVLAVQTHQQLSVSQQGEVKHQNGYFESHLDQETNHFSTFSSSASYQREENPSVGLCVVHSILEHSLQTYFEFGFPFDSLNANEGYGVNDRGSLYTTLIDSLDTLAITNHTNTFLTSVRWIVQNVPNFDINGTVSVFETIIRILGGLISAHLMIEEGIMPDRFLYVEDGKIPEEFIYHGELLILATDVADRLISSFDNSLGTMYGSANLHTGQPMREDKFLQNSVIGTNILEMMLLSHFTEDPKYRELSEQAAKRVFVTRESVTHLMPTEFENSFEAMPPPFTTTGSGQDSTVEYFLKYHILSGKVMPWRFFESSRIAWLGHLRAGGLYYTRLILDNRPFVTSQHDTLSNFYPGLLLLGGRKEEGVEPLWTVQALLRRFGSLPDKSSLDLMSRPDDLISELRPEHAESVYFYYHATHDPAYQAMGEEFAMGLHLRARVGNGFSPLNRSDLPPKRLESYKDNTESYFIAETLKYLYLLMEEAEWTKKEGLSSRGRNYSANLSGKDANDRVALQTRPWMLDWVFSTEAHMFPNSYFFWAPEVFRRRGVRAPGIEEEIKLKNEKKEYLKINDITLPNEDLSSWSFYSPTSMTVMRLENIHNLMSLSDFSKSTVGKKRKNGFRKFDWLWEDHLVGDAGYLCLNQPLSSLRRLSQSFYR